MKRLILCLAVLACTGCASQRQFAYSSDEGKKCYFTCKSSWSACKAKCQDILCRQSCNDSEGFCMDACSDVKESGAPTSTMIPQK